MRYVRERHLLYDALTDATVQPVSLGSEDDPRTDYQRSMPPPDGARPADEARV